MFTARSISSAVCVAIDVTIAVPALSIPPPVPKAAAAELPEKVLLVTVKVPPLFSMPTPLT
jgi:hypothetical protein